jgi:inorganic pyrophosphatase
MKFWEKLDILAETKEVVIDRPKGSVHPRYSDYVYPYDYGYLKDTTSADGDGIDVWLGSSGEKKVTGIIVTLDSVKSDMENKILLGCSVSEMYEILKCHQRGEMVAELVIRPEK